MTEDSRTTYKFAYAVLYSSAQKAEDGYLPFVPIEESRSMDTTAPHGLSRELVPALPALWYSLHLPRSSFDYREVPGSSLIASYGLDVPQEVLLVPFPLVRFEPLASVLRQKAVDLIFCADNDLVEVNAFAAELGGVLEVCPFSALNAGLLAHHWKALGDRVPRIHEGFDRPPPFMPGVRSATTLLPVAFLERRLSDGNPFTGPAEKEPVHAGLMAHVTLAVAAHLQQLDEGAAGLDEESARALEQEAAANLQLSVVLAAPGVPRSYRKAAFANHGPFRFPANEPRIDSTDGILLDAAAEECAIRYLATHLACGREGLAQCLPAIPDDLWIDLATLENGYAEAKRKPRKVQRLLKSLGQKVGKLFDEPAIDLVKRASSIACFSGFPIGLAILPGATAPLACIKPITYRPLLPLIRAIAQEGIDGNSRYWGRGFRLLVAECLEESDSIRKASEAGWRVLERAMKEIDGVECHVAFPTSVTEFRELVASVKPQALVLSAHGFYQRDKNVAGLIVGGVRVIGPELGRLPDAVILSACHVGPRGIGAVNVADLLLRQGATAVLSTQIPVDVQRNSMLMVRLFSNLGSTIKGDLPFRSLLEIWHHTASSNAVNDILQSTESLSRWSVSTTPSGRPVIQEFMLNRSAGRLSLAHIYRDTEVVLLEIAKEMGFDSKLRSVLEGHGYVPETSLYQFLGRPEKIIVQDRAFDAISRTREDGSL